jgi:serine phosphatase RsbU (regulator of sigma subunit)
VSLLNEIILEKGIASPGKILDQLRHRIIQSLKQDSDLSKHKDGMDISLLRIDKRNKTAIVSSAMNKVVHYSGGKLEILRGDKQPIGISYDAEIPFSEITLKLKEGDLLYLMTDGISDQFGGKTGKKFKFKRLMDLIETQINHMCQQQHKNIVRSFDEWRGDFEQLDDVCLIGVRF